MNWSDCARQLIGNENYYYEGEKCSYAKLDYAKRGDIDRK